MTSYPPLRSRSLLFAVPALKVLVGNDASWVVGNADERGHLVPALNEFLANIRRLELFRPVVLAHE